ncbi:MAG: signal peptide peptidase SppA [bacterium]|nr:signal peptide peptidase SppA [bacterium]
MNNFQQRSLAFCVLIAFALSGCISVSLGNRTARDKLKETVVQGEGWQKVLILDITGFISNVPPWRPYAPPATTLIDVKEKLRKAAGDKRIKAVVLRINSPGGTVTASDTIAEELLRFKAKTGKPIVAMMLDTAASGGYYVAVSADRIVAQPTTITGSIGVIIQKFDIHELLGRLGIANTPVKSGIHKDIGSPFRPGSEREAALLQETIDTLYNRFVDRVTENRAGLSRDEVVVLADGRIYTADQALHHGLIDEIGYLDDAIDQAKAMAGLEKARVVIYRLPQAYKENIYSTAPGAPVTEIHLLDPSRNLPWEGAPFLYLWDPRGTL